MSKVEKKTTTQTKRKPNPPHKTKSKTDREWDELTIKEQNFILAYIETGNGAESVRRAGYSAKDTVSATVQANRLLKKIYIANWVNKKLDEKRKPTIATGEEMMEYLTAVARGEIKDELGFDTPINERTKAALEILKRTKDVQDRVAGKQVDNVISIKLDWGDE